MYRISKYKNIEKINLIIFQLNLAAEGEFFVRAVGPDMLEKLTERLDQAKDDGVSLVFFATPLLTRQKGTVECRNRIINSHNF